MILKVNISEQMHLRTINIGRMLFKMSNKLVKVQKSDDMFKINVSSEVF